MVELSLLMLLKTTGLEYDDRVRKESLTLKKKIDDIFISVLRQDNKKMREKTSYGISFEAISLFTRKFFSHKKFLFLKLIEMYVKFLIIVFKRKPNIVWIHNQEMMGLLPILYLLREIGFIKKIIWDQHELLNESYIDNNIKKEILKLLFYIPDQIIVANEERYNYYLDNFNNNYENKIHIIHNYADKKFENSNSKDLPFEIKKWLGGKSYILAQGGANKNRYIEEMIEAIIKMGKYKLIVVGPYNKEIFNLINKNHSCNIYDYIYFTGMIPQMEMIDYIDNAKASMIFYKNTKLNSKYCEPNRLYQAIIRGLPVIVGENPPMRNLVKKYNNGIVLNSDGNNKDDIIEALVKLNKNYIRYKNNANECKNKFSWEVQENVIFDLFDLNE